MCLFVCVRHVFHGARRASLRPPVSNACEKGPAYPNFSTGGLLPSSRETGLVWLAKGGKDHTRTNHDSDGELHS